MIISSLKLPVRSCVLSPEWATWVRGITYFTRNCVMFGVNSLNFIIRAHLWFDNKLELEDLLNFVTSCRTGFVLFSLDVLTASFSVQLSLNLRRLFTSWSRWNSILRECERPVHSTFVEINYVAQFTMGKTANFFMSLLSFWALRVSTKLCIWHISPKQKNEQFDPLKCGDKNNKMTVDSPKSSSA
jgi:hypothetical protein